LATARYGILLRIEQIKTRGALLAEQGALYPALSRARNIRVCWIPNGGLRTTIGAPSSIDSLDRPQALREKRKAGIV